MKKLFLLLFSICYGKINAQIITTIAGIGTGGFSGDGGQAVFAELNYPTGVALDSIGNLYISDKNNSRIRKVDLNGVITTVAGNTSGGGFSGDGGPATAAALMGPNGVDVDKDGNIFIADYFNNRIRKVDTSGIITTVAGNGILGYSGDGGPAVNAKLFDVAIACGNNGELYISDGGNNRVRMVNTAGIIQTVAGNGSPGTAGDGGPATSAELYFPAETAIDKYGNFYIADYINNLIRKVDTAGILTTVAGNGIPGYSGDGGPAILAQLSNPTGLALDTAGILYISDTYNHRVRRVSPSGIITTVAGNGTNGFSGDGGLAVNAALNRPYRIRLDAEGNIYIADLENNRVRKVTPSKTNAVDEEATAHFSLYPNPANTQFTIDNPDGKAYSFEMLNMLGEVVYASSSAGSKTTIDLGANDIAGGAYVVRIITTGGTSMHRLIVER